MGVYKKNKTKQHNNFMGRSLMRNKLLQKEISDNILYSKIGNDEDKKVSKHISFLDKAPLDDYLDNQLVINSVQVSKVFIQKNEIKEKKRLRDRDKGKDYLEIQNIILPIPGRPFLLKHQDKVNIILHERENAPAKKKKRKNVKKISFLMSGKSLIPINVRSTKGESSRRRARHARTATNGEVCADGKREVDEEAAAEGEVAEEEDAEEDADAEEHSATEEHPDAFEGEAPRNLRYMRMYEALGEKYKRLNVQEVLNKESVDKYELEHFVEWRKLLSIVEEEEGYIITPYEKNIEYWRQLWRVIEKSHLLMYIIDARNPIFFYCQGLEYYIKKVDPRKEFYIILNKSDFLSYEERKEWAAFFQQRNVKFIFFSALRELYHQNKVTIEDLPLPLEAYTNGMSSPGGTQKKKEERSAGEGSQVAAERSSMAEDRPSTSTEPPPTSTEGLPSRQMNLSPRPLPHEENKKEAAIDVGHGSLSYEEKRNDQTDILSTNEMVSLIQKIKNQKRGEYHDLEIGDHNIPKFMVGFIGFPNVGKSSIINSLVGAKKVSVSRQPGKTKHFQTIPLKRHDFSLCDCPGLIFPSLVFSKYDLILNGVFSVDHCKGNLIDLVQILCNIIPHQLCDKYRIDKGLICEVLLDAENGRERRIHPYLDATEFLSALCSSRRYVSGGKGGLLNLNFATRLIIRDFITGKLLYNFMPSYLARNAHVYRSAVSPGELLEASTRVDRDHFSQDPPEPEEILTTKRKFRYMQKKLVRGKNVMKHAS
ncbi:hypothetical protein C922_03080 [Plasmodium inui San Antonio 1]|uniref:G domain-containing protein n=1 Tax=Plasmodium inui San Antonio 1 TaxID=1237626 RepID=W7AM96_9APIC|nr:hypothetical protein C922_03080 [Plasmodium inui San Antonio 1]EUD66446.1 hypothetical protein C922_03080 [Plasmodium inui San Antonio 1]